MLARSLDKVDIVETGRKEGSRDVVRVMTEGSQRRGGEEREKQDQEEMKVSLSLESGTVPEFRQVLQNYLPW